MKILFDYYKGENAIYSWEDSKKTIRRFKKFRKTSDQELLDLLNHLQSVLVDVNEHGGNVGFEFQDRFDNEESDGSGPLISMDTTEIEYVKLFICAFPRLKSLLEEKLKEEKE